MDDLKIVGRQNDGFETPLGYRVLPGGVLPTAGWITQLIQRGFGWHFPVGTFASGTDTGLTGGGAGTIMDLDQPEFCISVPAGYCLIPHEIHVAARPGLATTDSHVNDILLAVDTASKWAGDGTVTTATPRNLRGGGAGCPLPCFTGATADITDPVLTMELARATKLTDVQGTAATVNLQDIVLHYEPKNPPLLVGPCALYGYFGGSIAVVGFASVNFLAVPSSLFTGLS